MDQEALVERFMSIHSRIRSRFPQIERDIDGHERTYLNSGAGTLTVDSSIRALAKIAMEANPQPGAIYPAEIATEALHGRVREMVSDFIHAQGPEEVSFHGSATHALMNLSYSLRAVLTAQHSLIVTDLDHMANISPWEDIWGRGRGCEIRRARVNDEGHLDVDHLISLVDEKTGLVAVTMASNGFGSVVPLREMIPLVRKKSAHCLVCVDAVHHALHGSIDVQALDCDFLVFSGYKVFGPMVGVLWGRRHLLDRLEPYRVETNTNAPPGKFEQGTLNNAVLAALEGALAYLLWLGDELAPDVGGPSLSRSDRFGSAMKGVAAYEGRLSEWVLEGFQRLEKPRFRCYGVTEPSRVRERDPTFLFEISGKSAEEIKRCLWEGHGFQIADGNHYSAAVCRHLGRASICRTSFAHYDTLETAQRFVEAVEWLLG